MLRSILAIFLIFILLMPTPVVASCQSYEPHVEVVNIACADMVTYSLNVQDAYASLSALMTTLQAPYLLLMVIISFFLYDLWLQPETVLTPLTPPPR